MEVYRYFWTKATDRAGRVASSQAAIRLMERLEQGPFEAPSHGKGDRAWTDLPAQARQYLGPGTEQTIKIVVAKPRSPVEVEVMRDEDRAGSRGEIEIAIATMPSGYTRDDAVAWLSNPVGVAWAAGAHACHLGHAVATRSP